LQGTIKEGLITAAMVRSGIVDIHFKSFQKKHTRKNMLSGDKLLYVTKSKIGKVKRQGESASQSMQYLEKVNC
jgi:hypothetical protein